jgi:putative transcriptional regulator
VNGVDDELSPVFFFLFETKMTSRAGKLLIASPNLIDSPFERSVVLVLQDNTEGAVGVVLNRPANGQIQEVWKEITEGWSDGKDRLFFGGPMSGPILAVHGIKSLGEVKLSKNIFAAATESNLKLIVAQEQKPYRIFFGLSGWKPGQLESEIEDGFWIVADAKRSYVLKNHSDLWKQALRDFGRTFIKRVVAPKHLPKNPSLN